MVAKDAKIFDKYGLDVEMIFFMGASSLILQSMLSGAADFAGFAGPAIISNVLQGGDVITVDGDHALDHFPDDPPEDLERGEDLKGKKIGISKLGAVPHFAIQLILDRFNVQGRRHSSDGRASRKRPPVAAAGAIVDAAVLSLPRTVSARQGRIP